MTTRFRLPSSGTPDVSPALQSYTHSGTVLRAPLPLVDSSALAVTALSPDGVHTSSGDTFFAQFISAPLAAGVVFTAGDAVKQAVQAAEASPDNNLQVQLFIGLVSNDGTTALATLRSKVLEGAEVATIGVGLRNTFFSTTLGGSYTTTGTERLVVELSLAATPTVFGGHNGSLRFGSDGASGDLPENDTELGTTFNPWIEFTNTLEFSHVSSGALVGAGAAVAGAAARAGHTGGVAVIRHLLANDASITAIVPASRITAGDLPINTTLPAIAVTQISGVPRLTMAMTERPVIYTDRVQVSAIFKGPAGAPGGGGYHGVKAMIANIIQACPNQHGIINACHVDSILPDTVGPDPQDDATSLFSQSVDFIVKWHFL